MSTDSRKVIILGAGGLLGAELKKVFAEGYQTLAVDQPEVDLLRPAETAAFIRDRSPNLVVHAAAYTAVDRAEEEADLAVAVNDRGTEAVAEGARSAGACLVYFSTDYVFDGLKGTPYEEGDEPRPLSVYAESKLAGERAVARIMDRYLIVRTAWMFGPAKSNFVSGMAKRAKEGARTRVVTDQVGSPTYAPHLAAAVRRLYELRIDGVVNVTNSGVCSWFDLARETYRLAGAAADLVVPIFTSELRRAARRPAYSALSTAKYARLAGRALPTWQQALAEYLGK